MFLSQASFAPLGAAVEPRKGAKESAACLSPLSGPPNSGCTSHLQACPDPTFQRPLVCELADSDVFQSESVRFKERDVVCACAAGLPSRGEVAKLDEIFPVAPAAFNDAEKLARFLLGLFDGIDDDPVCAHYGLVIDLT